MTAPTTDLIAAQEQLLEDIRQRQQVVVDAVRALTEAAGKATPAVATPGLPADLPQPGDVVAGAFDFAEKLLATQRDFAEKLVAAGTPAPAEATAAERPDGD